MPKDKKRRSRTPERRRSKHKRRSRSRSSERRHERKRHESATGTSDIEDPIVPPKLQEFSFENYKKDLDILFFSDRDVIKKDTTQYDEFWKFFNKYQAVRRKQGVTTWSPPRSQPVSDNLGIPTNYHRSFLLNFGLNLPSPDKLLNRLPPDDPEARKAKRPRLTRENLMEFHHIILLYLEFLQREKMVKLKKLRESQSKLPIAQFREEIIQAVRDHQVVIIAGKKYHFYYSFIFYLKITFIKKFR